MYPLSLIVTSAGFAGEPLDEYDSTSSFGLLAEGPVCAAELPQARNQQDLYFLGQSVGATLLSPHIKNEEDAMCRSRLGVT